MSYYLEPNGPRERFAYVVKQYRDSALAPHLNEVANAALMLVGADTKAAKLRRSRLFRRLRSHQWMVPDGPERTGFVDVGRRGNKLTQQRLDEAHKLADKYPLDSLLDELDRRMSTELPEHNPLDFVIPWYARELARALKGARRAARRFFREGGYDKLPYTKGREGERRYRKLLFGPDVDYDSQVFLGSTEDPIYEAAWAAWRAGDIFVSTLDEGPELLPAIAMWAEATNADLNQTSFSEALDAIREWEGSPENIPPGWVVYEYPDGWTVQRLGAGPWGDATLELEAEGKVMQHCVGGRDYIEMATEGDIAIFSLRDPEGRPHVTIEYSISPDADWPKLSDYEAESLADAWEAMVADGPGAVAQDETSGLGSFRQIMGKQNTTPKRDYAERVEQFIYDRFAGDPIGLLLTGTESPVLMAGMVLEEVDFTIIDLPEGWPKRVDWRAGEYRDVKFPDIRGADFENATFVHCDFEEELEDVSFRGATFDQCAFRDDLIKCDFTGAVLIGADETDINRQDVDRPYPTVGFYFVFVRLTLDQCTFDDATLQWCAMFATVFRDCDAKGTRFDRCAIYRCIFDGVRFSSTTSFKGTGGSDNLFEDTPFAPLGKMAALRAHQLSKLDDELEVIPHELDRARSRARGLVRSRGGRFLQPLERALYDRCYAPSTEKVGGIGAGVVDSVSANRW